MIKILKQKLFITTIFAVLLICGSCAFLVPNVNAEVTSNVQEQTNSILGSLLGINPDSYSTNINSQTNSQDNGHSQNQIDFILDSNQGSVRVHSSFINNNLNMLYLCEYHGTLAATQPADRTAGMAKEFLENYQAYTRNSFYSTLAQTLDDVNGSASTTKTVGNITLKVLNSNQATVDYTWTYTDANGIVADSKKVLLSYYQGRLEVFLDNWPFYNVVGAPTVSKQQAITNALAAVQNYTYQVTVGKTTSISVAGFQASPESLKSATLCYVNAPCSNLARDSNPFNLYPSWWVPIGFDKFYPGDVTGIAVTVWADTGQVSSTELMYADSELANALNSTANANQAIDTSSVSEGIDQEVNQSSMPLIAPVVTAAILCIGLFFVSKRSISQLLGGKKLFNPLLCGMLLCCIILMGATLSGAKADSVFPNSSARIYASLDGSPGYPPGSPPQSQEENDSAYWVQTQLHNDFIDSGYTVYNDVGNPTTRSNVMNYTSSDSTTYDHCTVFQYGHMNGFGEAYVDNTGDSITHDDISNSVTNSNYKFVLLWVCAQAENSSSKMPDITPMCNAWMSNGVSSENGYTDPDNSGKCFISFYGFSPWIGNDTRTFEEQWTPSMKNFIEDFYDNALVGGYDIHQSLNQASLSIFNTTYSSSILYTDIGYNLWWPGSQSMDDPFKQSGWYPQGFPGHQNDRKNSMQVLGDSSIYLFQPKITLSSNHGLSPTFYIGGEAHNTGEVHVTRGTYSVDLGSNPSGYGFWYLSSTYQGHQYNLPCNYYLQSGGTLTAIYYYATPTAPSTPDVSGPIPSQTVYAGYEYQFCASSTDPNELETIAYTFYWGDGTNTTVGGYSSGDTAYASHTWSSTGEYYVTVVAQDSYGLYSDTSDPVGVNVEELIPTYNLNLDAYDDTWTQINVGAYIDNNWVGTTPCVAYLHAGTYYVSFDNSFYEWWGDYEYLVSGSGYVPISSDTGVTAYYAVQGK